MTDEEKKEIIARLDALEFLVKSALSTIAKGMGREEGRKAMSEMSGQMGNAMASGEEYGERQEAASEIIIRALNEIHDSL